MPRENAQNIEILSSVITIASFPVFSARFREIGTGSAAIPAADNLELNFGCGRRPRQDLRAKFRGKKLRWRPLRGQKDSCFWLLASGSSLVAQSYFSN
jgi:hypothetical protein